MGIFDSRDDRKVARPRLFISPSSYDFLNRSQGWLNKQVELDVVVTASVSGGEEAVIPPEEGGEGEGQPFGLLLILTKAA